MNIVQIPKKSGGFRTIYVVKGNESILYKSHVGEIAKRARKLDNDNVMHGFVKGRSPVTAAKAHINHAWTVCYDIEDFFDNVTETKLKGLLPKKVIDTVIVDGAARQGLPTSPSVANVAAAAMDKAILRFINKYKLDVVYTRYADDLTFSGDKQEHMDLIIKNIPVIVGRCGWRLRKDKTHIQLAKHGRRHICGVTVDDDGIYPTRHVKRKLRAALHRASNGSEKAKKHAAGLKEWVKLKEPAQKYEYANTDLQDELKSLCKVWGISVPKNLPYKETIIDGDFMITGDPVYILGCSTWTTGWTSCLAHPNGGYRRGSIWWCRAPGTRMAALLSSKTKEIGGVTRRVMRARAFVHTMRCGTLAYDRIYGECESKEELKKTLEQRGIVFVRSLPNGIKTIGHVISGSKPYLDNLSAKRIKVRKNNKILNAIVLHT